MTEKKKLTKVEIVVFFNITKFSYTNIGKAELETFSEIDGVDVNDLPIDNASAFSLQTINGYFFSPYFFCWIRYSTRWI